MAEENDRLIVVDLPNDCRGIADRDDPQELVCFTNGTRVEFSGLALDTQAVLRVEGDTQQATYLPRTRDRSPENDRFLFPRQCTSHALHEIPAGVLVLVLSVPKDPATTERSETQTVRVLEHA